MDRSLKISQILATIILLSMISAPYSASEDFSQFGVTPEEKFRFLGKEHQLLRYLEDGSVDNRPSILSEGYIVGNHSLIDPVTEGGFFTVNLVDGLITESLDSLNRPKTTTKVKVTHGSQEVIREMSVKGSGSSFRPSFIISTNWEAQRVVFQEEIDARRSWNDFFLNNGTETMLDNSTHIGWSFESWPIDSIGLAISEKIFYEKMTGVLSLHEWKVVNTNSENLVTRTDSILVVRTSLENAITDDLTFQWVAVTLLPLMFIAILRPKSIYRSGK